MTSKPPLDSYLSNHGSSLTVSFLTAILITACLCGILAAISLSQKSISERERRTPLMAKFESVIAPVTSKTTPEPIRVRVIAPQSSPVETVAFVKNSISPSVLEIPIPPTEEITIDDFAYEEYVPDNPFAKRKAPAPKVVKKTASKKTKGHSEAEKKKREERRLAALSKKISQQAIVTSRSTPHYPRTARRKGHQGRIVITVTVNTSGKVSSPRISKSSGHASLDRSALKAALKHRFRPALNALGQPIAVQRKIPFNFKLTS